MRSGNSFQKGPSASPFPPSTATMPSSRLQRSRNWQNKAARISKTTRVPALPAAPESQNEAAASAAMAMLACDIWFGVAESAVIRRASA